MTEDINDVSHTSTLAKFEEAVRKDKRSRTSQEAATLKPCPFCGSRCVTLTTNTANWPIVQCDDCGSCGACTSTKPDEAVTLWNRRFWFAQRPAEEAFEKWFDNHFLDPDGGSSHLPDWLKDDLRLAWDAALSHSSIAGNSQCQQQWQPIETAPKDGNEILVSCGVGHPTRLAFWDAARNNCWSVWPGRAWIEPLYWTPLPALTDTSTERK
jgi:Lar family restriction alleviation protein